jgi:hypothetical protein
MRCLATLKKGFVTRKATLRGGVGVVLLFGAAFAIVQWEPWHGPIILTLSTAHGVHLADLIAVPLLALAVFRASRAALRPLGAPRLRRRARRAAPAGARGRDHPP